MKKRVLVLGACLLLALSGCGTQNTATGSSQAAGNSKAQEPKWTAINSEGTTLETRINVPNGYTRSEIESGGFASFLRGYSLKPDGSKVLLYNGTPKGNQNLHVAVYDLPIEAKDLQQCADAIMRLYGEYYYAEGEYSKIKFPMGAGFVGDFDKWRQGNKIVLDGNDLYWANDASNDSSYNSFVKFMQQVFNFSGTMNMDAAAKKVDLEDAQIGDIFIKGGSPGHVVMIVDMCENSNGEKAFLLGQGYMPAQDFHVIKNPLHSDNPWYYASEITYPFQTAEYLYPQECLKRLDW